MAILDFERDTDRCVLQLQRGKWADQKFRVFIGTCDNPLCPCAIVNLACVCIDGPEPGADAPPPMRFALDLAEQQIDLNPGRPVPSAVSMAFAKHVAAELDDEDWANLYGWFLGVKRDLVERADVGKLDAVFPAQVMAGDGTMVGYTEIFPFAHRFEFLFRDAGWFVGDQYCVAESCPCRNAALTFVGVPRDAGPDLKLRGEDQPTIFYDYTLGRMERTACTPRAGQPEITELLNALKIVHPTLNAELRKRHQKLRVLFHRAVAEEAAGLVRREPKVGRNDPCPCGSGRKFKKCCGA